MSKSRKIKKEVEQCPKAAPGLGHFYWLRMTGAGEIKGFRPCQYCGKPYGSRHDKA